MDFRTIWISDVHLGSRACRVGLLLDFLRTTRCDTLYLVGDLLDLESLRRTFYWPPSHTEATRLLLDKARDGTRVVYIPGNHDHDLRALCGMRFGNIEVAREALHTTKTGRRLLVLHGDEFDSVIHCGVVAAFFGSIAYRGLLGLNRFVHWLHELTGRPYWSLAEHVKSRVGKARRYIERFRRASVQMAADRGLDGVVCGHIHKAEVATDDGVLYCNDGDWVESCTALVETRHGALELISWRSSAAVVELSALSNAA
jgi:UDP-2,3-diacylglucosamine pyrophosphatase LpxH